MRTVYANNPNSGYDSEDVKKELEAFQRFFPNKRLLAIQLDGFSHNIVYDDVPKSEKAHVITVSFCMGAAEELSYCGTEDERKLQTAGRGFLEYIGLNSHAGYQNNPKEIIYVLPEDR